MSVVLLFDDDVDSQNEIVSEYAKLSPQIDIDRFDASKELPKGFSYERHIEEQLAAYGAEHEITLIACDKELGAYDEYKGLSANAVSAVAKNLGLPFCQYSRNFGGSEKEFDRFEKLRRWDSEDITLDGESTKHWAEEIAGLAAGFSILKQKCEVVGSQKKPRAGDLLAEMMGRPDSASALELYGSGDQSVMTEIFAFIKEKSDPATVIQRMPRVLGNWLWLSIMRFPGILVNRVAAASFLNISCNDFDTPSVASHFQDAMYQGPFAGLGDWWWREDLETMILEDSVKDGLEFLSNRDVEVSACVDEQTDERAGYYCMITHTPVSRKNSEGDINWFPSGANLARIRQDKYEEITSLVSI